MGYFERIIHSPEGGPCEVLLREAALRPQHLQLRQLPRDLRDRQGVIEAGQEMGQGKTRRKP